MATDEDFQGFFAQHYERLCRLGFLLTGDPAQAEELAQDALVRPGGGGAGGRTRQPGDLRPQGAGQPAPVAAAPGAGRSSLPVPRPPDRGVQRRAPRGRDRAVGCDPSPAATPAGRAGAALLRDLSEAEIARVLGIPVGTVKTLARRGLARLRRSLDATTQDPTLSSKERS